MEYSLHNDFITDTVNVISKAVGKIKILKSKMEYVIIDSGHAFDCCFAAAAAKASAKLDSRVTYLASSDTPTQMEILTDLSGFENVTRYIRIEDYTRNSTVDGIARMFFYFDDFADGQSFEERSRRLEKIFRFAASDPCSKFMYAEHIPLIGDLPSEVQGISEREYEVIFRDFPEDSPEKTLLKMEDICRKYNDSIDIRIARIDNIIGPCMEENSVLGITAMIREMIAENKITVDNSARNRYYSATCPLDVASSLWALVKGGKRGNIYNVSSWHFNLFEPASILYTLFSDRSIKLEFTGECTTAPSYHLLNRRKFGLIKKAGCKIKPSGLRRVIHFMALSELHDSVNVVTEKVNVYYGKINYIRRLELELVLEIDRICRENDIKYFLAGGSMLGAVRHNGFIPWDDDMDIGMLYDDYKKFLEVAPKCLSEKYSYQNTKYEPTSLYIHDKIRIKNTFFSTDYSAKFNMENGVYVDIFVYTKTSDIPSKQKKHIRMINFMRRVMGYRWTLTPRKSKRYKWVYPVSRLAIPFMRMIPTTAFRNFYTRIITKYEKKNTHFLIDATGFNLDKVGAFPREWFDGIIYHDFCGHSLPILERYDDYLKHWYGENYMELLPVSDRNSVHKVIRIDLGEKLCDDPENYDFHQLNFKGELYEKRRSEK